jgi:hypothetical protein
VYRRSVRSAFSKAGTSEVWNDFSASVRISAMSEFICRSPRAYTSLAGTGNELYCRTRPS